MDEYEYMRQAIAQNTKDIKDLSALFHSSFSDLKQVHENQKIVIDLLQAKVQASTEISSIKETLTHINNHLSSIEGRLTTMEHVHGGELQRQKAKYDFVKIIDAIGKLAIMAVLFSIFIVNPIDVHNFLFGGQSQNQSLPLKDK